MALAKRYAPEQTELELDAQWQADGIFHFDPEASRPIYSIDSPPATVSGKLHMGHIYSYSHADFMARFFRMNGFNVFYPMGFDDNGLPTDRLVEKREKVTARQVGRKEFTELCLRVSEEEEKEYRKLWQRLGLSIDWRYSYRTIDEHARRCSQHSFIDLYQKGLVYRAQAPAIWCPECRTAIAQADLEDRERESEFVTLPFTFEDGAILPIATTRPELLAACVAVFVHPNDDRYRARIGQKVQTPLYGAWVNVLPDPAADPQKGTGAVMCCTFGDQTDVTWWKTHHLPMMEAIDASGRMLPIANLPGEQELLAGLAVPEARKQIKALLAARGLILGRQSTSQSVRVHERCDTPVEYRLFDQWFVRLLDHKEKFLELGRQLRWHPEHMHARYQDWVENLNWDWCISRQRAFGVPFPVWYCKDCGEIMLAQADELPVDPLETSPRQPCSCGSTEFIPDGDVMDTWATSSVSPQIVSGWLDEPQRFEQLFPMTLRPQAHEIIRTWAFYSVVKSWFHFGRLPWSDVFISGWGIAGEGMGKISKSKGGGPVAPMQMITRYSADALRYWASSTSPGKDAVISEEKIQQGVRLVTKLWNVARFAEPFLKETLPPLEAGVFTPADRWILASCDRLVERVTAAFMDYEYASAKSEIENFFWHRLADNYLEMVKLRLYDAAHPTHAGACHTLKQVLKALLKLLAPLLPYITDAIWQELYAEVEGTASIHQSDWPKAALSGSAADGGSSLDELALGELLVSIATAVRRYKSEKSMSLGSPLERLQLATGDAGLAEPLRASASDLMGVTRAAIVEVCETLQDGLVPLPIENGAVTIAIG